MTDAKTPADKPTPAKKPAAAKTPAAKKPAAAPKKPAAAAKPAATSAAAATPAVPPVPPPPAAPAAAPVPPAAPPAAAPPPPPAPPYAGAPAQPAYPAAPAVVPLGPEEERNVAMLSHLISLLAILLSASWVSALIFYLVYKDRGPFVRQHTATELNFQLTMVIGLFAGAILSLVIVGILVLLAVPVLMIVFGIIASMRAQAGQAYEYPIAIKFVR